MTENDLNYFFGVDNHFQGRKTGLILAEEVMKRFSIVVHLPEFHSFSLSFYECSSVIKIMPEVMIKFT